MKKISFLYFILVTIFANFAFAEGDIDRAKNIYLQVRCATCQGQSIADSNSEHAKMMRDYIDQQIILNKSDEQILEDIRAAYGDYLVFDPKFSTHTIMLWLIPLLAGILVLVIISRKIKKI